MPSPVEIGEVLAGKYRVEKVLGQGGMGMVVAAWHLELETMVALKFLLPEVLENTIAVERFFREARAAVMLKSEHTCQVRDVGRLENGAPYIVMEYLEGSDLLEELRRRGALPMQEVASYIVQACMAMAEAHAVGIVHRDLKPQNLFLTHRGDGTALLKVLDFGIAKLRMDVSATVTAVIMGSPLYMAPEQARSAKDADLRSDIYSLGMILYQMSTGRLPHPALEKPSGELNITEVLLAVQMDEPIPPRTFNEALSPGFEAIVLRAIEKDPAKRFEDANALANALMPYANRRLTPLPFQSTATLVSPMLDSMIPESTTLSTAIHAGPTVSTPIPRKRKWMAPMLALSVVMVASVALVAVRVSSGDDEVPNTHLKAVAPPEPVKPEPVKPEPVKPEPVKPEPVKLEPVKPEPVVVPEPTKPTKPAKPTRPVVVKPQKPEPAKRCRSDDVICQFGNKSN